MEITLELTAEQGEAEVSLEIELNTEAAFSVLSLLNELGVTGIEDVNYIHDFLKAYVLQHYPDDDKLKQLFTEKDDASKTDATDSQDDSAMEETNEGTSDPS